MLGSPRGGADPEVPGNRRGNTREAGPCAVPSGPTGAALTALTAAGGTAGGVRSSLGPEDGNAGRTDRVAFVSLGGPGRTSVPSTPSGRLRDALAARSRDAGLDSVSGL